MAPSSIGWHPCQPSLIWLMLPHCFHHFLGGFLTFFASSHYKSFGLFWLPLDNSPLQIFIMSHNLWIFFSLPFQKSSKGPARVKGNSLIRLAWAPFMKWVIPIVSTIWIQWDRQYCSFNNIKNSCRDSLWGWTSITKFHLKKILVEVATLLPR